MTKHIILLLALTASLTANLFRLYAYDYNEFPQIDSVSPPNFSIVYSDRFDIFGSVSSRFELASVEIDKKRASLKSGVFKLSDLPLVLGKNIFLIKATDIFGNRKNFRYTIYRENPPVEPALKVERKSEILDKEVPANTPVDIPKAEGFMAPKQSTKTANSSAKQWVLSGTRPVQVYTNNTYTADTVDNSAQASQSAANLLAANPVAAPAEQNSGNLIVTFSSPYSDQVITENMLKIGGRFTDDAHVTAITVNGQACTLDASTGTFTGPMLISPGEARRRNVTSDNSEYIIMDVNPVTHSGKNILKVVTTNDMGRATSGNLTFYYYQLFVKANAYGEAIFEFKDGTTISLPVQSNQSFNNNLFYNPPYPNWIYPEMAYRRDAMLWMHKYDYSMDKKAFYFAYNYPSAWSDLNGENSVHGYAFVKTKLLLHTPPLKELPFILILKNFQLFEDVWPIFTPNPIAGYSLNGRPITLMENPSDSYGRFGYVFIDKYTPDTDYRVEIQTPDLGNGFLLDQAYINQYFFMDDIDTITGDVLVDSNNDGFLGGEDNAVEQVTPGCVFWVNNDDDYDESPVHPDDERAVNSNGNDGADESINGIRDLEDFMPINIKIPNIKAWASSDKSLRFCLKLEGGGAIRIFKRVQDSKKYGSLTYLKDLNSSIAQYAEQPLRPEKDNVNEILLDPNLFDTEGKFSGIFEGIGLGQLKLTLTAKLGKDNGKREVVLDEVYVTLKDIRDMYRFIDVRKGPTEGGDDNKLRYRDIVIKNRDMFMKDPSSVMIFIHGAWTSKSDAISWSSTLYKRLYITGYRGGFITVSWHSDEISGPKDSLVWYAKRVFDNQWVNSFQTGRVLADIIENTKTEFKNAKIDLMAHSLGGNLASYALRLSASQGKKDLVNNVFLIQAAVAGNAYASRPEVDYYKDMYVLSAANNITGMAYNLFYQYDDTLRWFNKDLGGNFVPGVIGNPGLPIALDDNYELLPSSQMYGFDRVDNYRHEKSKSEALGRQELNSKLPNLESRYKKYKAMRPYGIRDHLSFGTEYYYDVFGYYYFILYEEDEE